MSATAHGPTTSFDVVVPTIGRPSLARLVTALDRSDGPRPRSLIVVDDRAGATGPLALPATSTIPVHVVGSGGRGPAAARNAGWRAAHADWVAFLDDDVEPSPTWPADLAADLAACDGTVAASKGTVRVPRPAGRPPTDCERGVIALETSAWITADLAVRRDALAHVGGFDERFPRAYREDCELAMRLRDAGFAIGDGRRLVVHPIRQGRWSASVRAQRGNADDALMRRLHGPGWRSRGRAPAGMLPVHVAITALAFVAVAAAITRRAALAASAGSAATGAILAFWWRRVRHGPRTLDEWGRMAASSALIPFAATYHAATGHWRARHLAPDGPADRWGPR